MRECIVHFKLIKGSHSELLRGLLFLDKGQKPAIADFIDTFKRMGYDVQLENEQELIFAPLDPKETYKLDITKVEIKGESEDEGHEDLELRSIVGNLIRTKW